LNADDSYTERALELGREFGLWVRRKDVADLLVLIGGVEMMLEKASGIILLSKGIDHGGLGANDDTLLTHRVSEGFERWDSGFI
jgi:hypothetical protein